MPNELPPDGPTEADTNAAHRDAPEPRQGGDTAKVGGSEEKAESGKEAEAKGPLKTAANLLTNLKSLMTNAVIVATLVLTLWAGWREYQRDSLVIEPIDVPKLLTESGVSGQSVSQSLIARIVQMQAQAEIPAGRRRALQPTWTQVDIQVPGSTISIASVVRFVKRQLGTENLRIGGEVREEGNKYRLILRGGDSKSEVLVDRSSGKDSLDDLIRRSAELALEKISPCDAASFAYGTEFKNRDYPQTLRLIRLCIGNGSSNEQSAGFNLWGTVFLDQNKAEEALSMYRRAAGGWPCRYAEACANWGKVLSGKGLEHEALEKYADATRIDPRLAWAHLAMADSLLRIGAYVKAKSGYEKAIDLDATQLWAYVGVGDSLLAMGKSDEAQAAYRNVADIAERRTFAQGEGKEYASLEVRYGDAYQAWCRVLTDTGKPKDAIEKCGIAAQIDPRDTFPHTQSIWAYLNLWRPDLARTECERARTLQSDFAETRLACAQVAERLLDEPAAVAELQKLVDANPAYPGARRNLGLALARTGKFDAAVAQFEAALALNAADSDIYAAWGDALRDRGRHKQAVIKYEQALALNAGLYWVYAPMTDELRILGRDAEAETMNQRLSALPAGNAWAFRERGNLLFNLERYANAIKEFERSETLDAANGWNLALWAESLRLSGRPAEAVEMFKRSIAFDHSQDWVFNSWADALTALGRQPEAVAVRDQLLSLPATTWSSMREHGRALLALERPADALALFEEAATLNDGDSASHVGMADALRSMKRPQDALTK